jgi:hypothetical protein
MKKPHQSASGAGAGPSNPVPTGKPVVRKRHRWWRRLGITLLVIAAILGIARALLPWQVRKYVNRTLDRNEAYEGRIGAVEIHLWRGAYSIRDVKILIFRFNGAP